MLTTSVEALPYPVANDFAAIPQHLAAIATQLDGKIPGWDATFQGVSKSPSFLLRTGVDGASCTVGQLRAVTFDTVIFNNTTGTNVSGGFQQATNDVAGWWFVGVVLFMTTGGTTTAGAINKTKIAATYPLAGGTCGPGPAASTVITAVPTIPTGAVYGETAEDAQGGGPVTALGIMKLFGGAFLSVQFAHTDPGAGATRTIKAGSALWASRLGNV